MKTGKHLTLEQRKVISNGITHSYTLKMIAETFGYNPTSISKKVKRNCEIITHNIISEKHIMMALYLLAL